MVFTATTVLGQAFAMVVNGICAVVARQAHAHGVAALAVLLSQVYWRIARRIGRLDRLVQHWHAGTLPTPRIRAPRIRTPRPAEDSPAQTRPAVPRTPDSHAMLLRLAQPTAQYRGHLETFLERPDTRALVKAAPQAARILRPLCRILAIDLPEYLRLPPRQRPEPRPPANASAKPSSPPPPTSTDRPLPAYARAAARAWKKYDR